MADTAIAITAIDKKLKRKMYIKEYRERNKEIIAIKRRAWQAKRREIQKESTRRWRNKPGNRELSNAKQVAYRKEIKKLIYSKYGNICSCCGESNLGFLTIDHVNNDGYLDKNKNGKRHSGRALYNQIIKQGFPDKYQILCMNCNFGKSRNLGICPHQNYLIEVNHG